jgi:hypothetical protein
MIKEMKLTKTLTLFAAAVLFSIISTAQNTENDFLPKKGDFGTSILVSGLIDNINLSPNKSSYGQNILFAKYYLEDDLALRVGLGFSLSRSVSESSDSSGLFLNEVDSMRRSSSMNVSIGIEKHLTDNRRLDPYVFGQLDLSFIGKSKTETDVRQISTIGTASNNREVIRDGGFAIGVNAGAGFNYFLAKNFSVGSEVYLGLQYVSLGGGISDNTTNTTAGGNRSSTFNSREDITKTTNLNVAPTAEINFSYFF